MPYSKVKLAKMIASWVYKSYEEKQLIMGTILQAIKNQAGPLVGMLPSTNMRDRARKIYDMAKELQDDLAR